MAGENWLDHLDLGGGHWADLLTRLPYDRAQGIQRALVRDRIATAAFVQRALGNEVEAAVATAPGFAEAIMRAHLWACSLPNYLTGELVTDVQDVGLGDPEMVDKIETRALELYGEWRPTAYPKESPKPESPPSPTASTSDASAPSSE